jgi:penicillin-binding protein 1A
MTFRKRSVRRLLRHKKWLNSFSHFFYHHPSQFDMHRWTFTRWIGFTFTVIVATIFILCGIWLYVILRNLPDASRLENFLVDQSTIIMDREGNELYKIYSEENRTYVALEDMSPFLLDAVVSFEDRYFYSNPGIDIIGISRAISCIVLNQKTCGGGSTITQQLVKNVLLSPEKTLTRKARELVLAWRLDKKLSKNKILELYLNKIPYGGSIHGIEMASQKYFAKSADELTLLESSILAVLPNAPGKYSPYGKYQNLLTGSYLLRNKITQEEITLESLRQKKGVSTKDLLENVRIMLTGVIDEDELLSGISLNDEYILIYVPGKKDQVLERMVDDNKITEKEKLATIKAGAWITFQENRVTIKHPHFVFYVRDLLEAKYGKEVVAKGGLLVKTTLDPQLQNIAEKYAKQYTDANLTKYDARNAALVSANVKTGEILAFVGGNDYWDKENGGQVNMPLAKRQAGSSFKPIVYSLLFNQGYHPASIIYDTPTKFGEDEPQNFDGAFLGPLSIRKSLNYSRNIPAVKAYFLAGRQKIIIPFAKKLGITSLKENFDYGWPLALGSGDITMLEMLTAYMVFPNNGNKKHLYPLLEVRDHEGNILEKMDEKTIAEKSERVMKAEVAYLMNHTLSDTKSRPEYWNTWLSVPGHFVAAKTGTSNRRVEDKEIEDPQNWPILPQDTWVNGYTTSLATVVWAGNTDGKPMNIKASGLDTAGPLWKSFMKEALKIKPGGHFTIPSDGAGNSVLVKQKVVGSSGKLPTDLTPESDIKEEIFIQDAAPQEKDTLYQRVLIDKINNFLADEKCPAARVEYKIFRDYDSPYRIDFTDWGIGVDEWKKEQNDTLPKRNSPLCKEVDKDTLPDIKLLEPSLLQTSSKNFLIKLKAYAPNGVKQVEVWLDGKQQHIFKESPLVVNISLDSAKEKKYKLLLKIVDGNLFTSEKEYIITKVNLLDSTLPEVEIINPIHLKSVKKNEIIYIRGDVYDRNGGISYAKLFLDNTLLEKIKEPPFIWKLDTNLYTAGRHTLRLVGKDYAGNEKSHERIFMIDNAKNKLPSTAFSFYAPENRSYATTALIPFHFQIAPGIMKQAKRVELHLRGLTGYQSDITIFETEVTKDMENISTLSTTWKPDISGHFTYFLKVIKKDETVTLSEPHVLHIGN